MHHHKLRGASQVSRCEGPSQPTEGAGYHRADRPATSNRRRPRTRSTHKIHLARFRACSCGAYYAGGHGRAVLCGAATPAAPTAGDIVTLCGGGHCHMMQPALCGAVSRREPAPAPPGCSGPRTSSRTWTASFLGGTSPSPRKWAAPNATPCSGWEPLYGPGEGDALRKPRVLHTRLPECGVGALQCCHSLPQRLVSLVSPDCGVGYVAPQCCHRHLRVLEGHPLPLPILCVLWRKHTENTQEERGRE